MIALKENESITVKNGENEIVIQAYPNGEIEILPQDIVDINTEILSDSSGYVTISPHSDED